MAKIKAVVQIELDPLNPVSEICNVIMAVTPYHPGKEEEILAGVADAIEKRLNQLKGDEKDA